jgi:hypothetical protein
MKHAERHTMMKLLTQLDTTASATDFERYELAQTSGGIAHGTLMVSAVCPLAVGSRHSRCPGRPERHHEDHEHGHTDPRLGRVRWPVLVVLGDHRAGDDMTGEPDDGSGKEEGTAANPIHQEESWGDTHKLHHVGDARVCELGATVHPKSLEEGRGVVDDRVDTDELLEELQAYADNYSG